MSKKKYTLDLLSETKKIISKPISTFIESNWKLIIKDGSIMDEKTKGGYQHLVCKLIYLTLTSPYIIFVVNVVSQFMHAPTDMYMQAVECIILYYLKKNLGKSLLFTKSEELSIEEYSDADWVGQLSMALRFCEFC